MLLIEELEVLVISSEDGDSGLHDYPARRQKERLCQSQKEFLVLGKRMPG
jgi:hypothetical protein